MSLSPDRSPLLTSKIYLDLINHIDNNYKRLSIVLFKNCGSVGGVFITDVLNNIFREFANIKIV